MGDASWYLDVCWSGDPPINSVMTGLPQTGCWSGMVAFKSVGPSRSTTPDSRSGFFVYRSLVFPIFVRAASHTAKCPPAE